MFYTYIKHDEYNLFNIRRNVLKINPSIIHGLQHSPADFFSKNLNPLEVADYFQHRSATPHTCIYCDMETKCTRAIHGRAFETRYPWSDTEQMKPGCFPPHPFYSHPPFPSGKPNYTPTAVVIAVSCGPILLWLPEQTNTPTRTGLANRRT